MLVILKKDYQEVSREAALIVASAIRARPDIVLGLATGNTPLGLYKELIALHAGGSLDFSRATSFNLDEYLGLPHSHPQSFHYFMQTNFFSQVNLPADHVHIPDGTITRDYDSYCASYEAAIKAAGGIDLQILGIGRNGHIGFNEPTSSLASRTRLKALSRETIEDNRHFFPDASEMPRCAITMGIGTILDSRRVLLLASGRSKAAAVAKAIEGPITSSVSASALQMHPDVTFIIDEDAAYSLTQRDYYRHVEEMTRLFTPERLS
ncbi:MAG TPA: glucosamine-6-phosphate deaminase [Dongiaceae bacterium]|nr:glucosamine-6-phosphate deaminase [Dongiaceae bacterium]